MPAPVQVPEIAGIDTLESLQLHAHIQVIILKAPARTLETWSLIEANPAIEHAHVKHAVVGPRNAGVAGNHVIVNTPARDGNVSVLGIICTIARIHTYTPNIGCFIFKILRHGEY